MQSSASINLLKGRVNLLDEVLKWALTVGRLFVIIVEFVAFATFIFRFSLDRTLIDLHDKIKQEQAIVASLKDRETTYRQIQQKLTTASDLNKNGSRNTKVLTDIADFTPPEIKYNSFTIANNQISIDASVKSTTALTAFLNSLRKYQQISSVTVESLGNKNANGDVGILITATLK